MLFPWKRSELWLGSSRQEYSRILDVLSANNVRYSCGIAGGTGSARYLMGDTRIRSQWGENPEVSALYKIYVEKNSLEYARQLITQQK